MRSIPAVAAAAIAATLLLAGCTATPDGGSATSTPTAGAAPVNECAEPGSASDSVTVTGDIGALPTTAFQGPLTVDRTERTIVSEGDGDEVEFGDIAKIDFTIYNATSGDQVFTTLEEGQTPLALTVDTATYIAGIVNSVACVNEGSRVVSVIPPADGFGAAGGNEALGISATDALVMVADIESIVPDRADGEDQPVQDGFPTVALADDGTPTVTTPEGAAPTTTQIAVLKKGDGAVVAAGDQVLMQYQGSIWGSGTIFDQTWGTGGPRTLNSAQLIPGFTAALVGQTVGSQVLVVIPPDQGYGAGGNDAAGILGTDSLVFVIDILDTQAAG
ncbi:FKBP-type peptidyl-prolyl cis-trans isomerase [Herbiconiux sp. CPCC 203407]|uniref:peptidylprolyl isomerase n=1 Tax=Herbiconiux oxytropis TaxID=2970915 RepID=A0AA41XI87_9MICO|nr:FKBP-type peptidyl-prolyl cis-trans isomerase [Herbiconiux oxytropis]MCS5722601.1 FKBP-type peptidyl-prolyl cis-trans isomerase [Herbiconiux oxytropis]MCS5726385.1 FKBP-type peptidyl-prolyl cis-trans isomerase [Herbiconiux oxytropis]